MQRATLTLNTVRAQLGVLQHDIQYNVANCMLHKDEHVVHVGQIVCSYCELISDAKIIIMLFENDIVQPFQHFWLYYLVDMNDTRLLHYVKIVQAFVGEMGVVQRRKKNKSQHYFFVTSYHHVNTMLSLSKTK